MIRVDPNAPEGAVLTRAANILRSGGLVAFPTETVYGLGANALDPAAVARIYEAKGRPGYNPLIVHVADVDAARALSSAWPALADELAAAFWPGPLTLVVPKAAHVPDAVTAGLPSVALRIPAHPVALALLRAAALPVAAPSANRSTEISPSTAEHVAKSLGGRVDLILDGGPTRVGIESTVLDLTGPRPALLRPGSLSVDDLRPIAGDIVLPSADASGDAPRPSPGMMDRHYAPRAPLFTLGAGALTESVLRDGAAGRRAGVVSMTGDRLAGAETIVLPRDPAAYAAGLYAALHELDDRGVDVIYVEAVPDGAAWAGVRDRLRRASHRG